ncbi:MAG: putative uroporphyrinogen methylase [Gammaproteobacteria bacterium]|jgi:uncharacterized protein YabN with tetrapyrrole methylase and pyrophosphatase domain|nr:putative uroporphyrinogen methylase [Gammaproteobacteria bacterium]MCE3238685.1 putative uroporphyrinogen methylase [Gammaproteobacteria bacterium]
MIDLQLTLVGVGIKFLSHLTTEAKVYIEKSKKVLYLLNDPAMEAWIHKQNINAESLGPLYKKHLLRSKSYQAISEYIIKCLMEEKDLCVVFYGHPSVFAEPGLDAIKKADGLGIRTRILPGISAEDCLFADLKIDPGSSGCQSFETTDFLVRQRRFDPSSHLILWQVGIIGNLGHTQVIDNEFGATVLKEYLSKWYPLDHMVILYEASQYPSFEPVIRNIKLEQLPKEKYTSLTTLYIPPYGEALLDGSMLQLLKLV